MPKPLSLNIFETAHRYRGRVLQWGEITSTIGATPKGLLQKGWIKKAQGGGWLIDPPSEFSEAPKIEKPKPQCWTKTETETEGEKKVRPKSIQVATPPIEYAPKPELPSWKRHWKEFGPVVAGRQ